MCMCVYVCVCMCVCMCVCGCEREREREKKKKRERVCVNNGLNVVLTECAAAGVNSGIMFERLTHGEVAVA